MADSPAPMESRFDRTSLLRWGLIVLVAIGGAAVAATVALEVFADADFLERRLNAAFTDATGPQYHVDIGSTDWGFLGRSLRLRSAHLRNRGDTSSSDAAARGDTQASVRAAVPEIELRGIHRWEFLWRRTLTIDELVVAGARIRLSDAVLENGSRREAPSDTLRTNAPSPADTTSRVRVHRFAFGDGTVLLEGASGMPSDSVWGVSIQLDTLTSRSLRQTGPGRILASRFRDGSIGGLQYRLSNTTYQLEVGPAQLSRSDSVLRVGSIRFEPIVSDSSFMNQQKYRTNRVRTSVDTFEAQGIDLPRFVSDTAVVANVVRIDGLDLDVYRDNHLPEQPNDPPPAMPQDLVRSFAHPLDIDTIQVQNSKVRYSKRPEGVSEPGAIFFDDLWASIYHVSNNPQRMTESSPTVIDARTAVSGAGQLETTLRIPLLSPDLSLSYRGRLGSMDATKLNEAFVNLGGVRIKRGRVDSLWFDATVDRGVATGTLQAVYRNLEVETVEKGSGDQDLKNKLKTFVVNDLALRSKNRPTDDPFHSGQIEHERDEGDSFFKFLWHALRDGIYSLVGIDRIPG